MTYIGVTEGVCLLYVYGRLTSFRFRVVSYDTKPTTRDISDSSSLYVTTPSDLSSVISYSSETHRHPSLSTGVTLPPVSYRLRYVGILNKSGVGTRTVGRTLIPHRLQTYSVSKQDLRSPPNPREYRLLVR